MYFCNERKHKDIKYLLRDYYNLQTVTGREIRVSDVWLGPAVLELPRLVPFSADSAPHLRVSAKQRCFCAHE